MHQNNTEGWVISSLNQHRGRVLGFFGLFKKNQKPKNPQVLKHREVPESIRYASI